MYELLYNYRTIFGVPTFYNFVFDKMVKKSLCTKSSIKNACSLDVINFVKSVIISDMQSPLILFLQKLIRGKTKSNAEYHFSNISGFKL
jgi:hypothetical protein